MLSIYGLYVFLKDLIMTERVGLQQDGFTSAASQLMAQNLMSHVRGKDMRENDTKVQMSLKILI